MNTLTVLKKGACMREKILRDYGKIVYWDNCLLNLCATEDICLGHEDLTIKPISI